jgi:hypothetical protein
MHDSVIEECHAVNRYLAPEYFPHGIVEEKIDVFSYGILLLEIITGRKPVNSSQQNLLQWVSEEEIS